MTSNQPSNSYATDGKCHNSNAGTYNHECGKPATWLGIRSDGWAVGFCDNCKEYGSERTNFTTWKRL